MSLWRRRVERDPDREIQEREALFGFAGLGARTRVVLPYGGIRRLLCLIGLHDTVMYTGVRNDDTGRRSEWHCLCCGRLTAVMCSRFDGPDDPGDDDEMWEDDPDPMEPDAVKPPLAKAPSG